VDEMTVQAHKTRPNVDELPELDTRVALSGSVRQQEVGGAVCVSIAAGIAIYLGTSSGT
jgi:hypothetical protein